MQVFVKARQKLGEILSAFEFFDQQALDLTLKHLEGVRNPLPDTQTPFYLVIETSGSNEEHDNEKLQVRLTMVLPKSHHVVVSAGHAGSTPSGTHICQINHSSREWSHGSPTILVVEGSKVTRPSLTTKAAWHHTGVSSLSHPVWDISAESHTQLTCLTGLGGSAELLGRGDGGGDGPGRHHSAGFCPDCRHLGHQGRHLCGTQTRRCPSLADLTCPA